MLVETQLLVNYLKKCYEDRIVATFSEIDKIVPGKRYLLASAIAIASRDYGCIFINRRKVGYEPISNDFKTENIAKYRQNRIKGQIRRWQDEWQTIDTAKLSDAEYKKYLTNSIKLSAHEQIYNVDFDNRIDRVTKEMNKQSTVSYKKEAIAALIDVS